MEGYTMEGHQPLLTPVLTGKALDALKAFSQAPRGSDGLTPVESDRELDKKRDDVIATTLKPLVSRYLSGSISLTDFRKHIDRVNRQNQLWGFNLLMKAANEGECDRELRAAIREPDNEEDAAKLLSNFKTFVARVGQQFVEGGGGPHSKPRESSIPYFLSYFWQIHNQSTWSIYYTSAVQAMEGMNLWKDTGDAGVDYFTYKQLHNELREVFSKVAGRSFTLYDVEHVFWFIAEHDPSSVAGKRKVRTPAGEVEVAVPEDHQDESEGIAPGSGAAKLDDADVRQSIQIQAQIAEIGAKMGFHIWVAPGDRAKILDIVPDNFKHLFLDNLQLNYPDNTLDTIRQIDVLWLKRRSMARAFEIEHTTAIYSGLLRMADLLALQPNMQIKLHIVAPEERREKVLREIKRPVFSLLESGPLYKQCTFLPYDAIRTIAQEKFLSSMKDTILDEYEERAEEEKY
jgi:hypothetical protein